MGLQKHPGDAYLSGALGAALCRLKRFAPALKPLTLATRLQPRNPFWWGLLAQASIYESRQKQAFAALRQGEKLSPRDVFLLETRAECEFRVLRLQACEKTCIRILGINPASLRGHTLLIKVRRLTDRSKEAVTAANAGLKAVGSAKAGAILLERGIALLNLNRLAAAIADLEKAAHLLKTNPIPHQHLAKAWRQAGNRQKAAGARRTWQRLRKASGHQQ
jgi:Flp pilus assembly protein TadD